MIENRSNLMQATLVLRTAQGKPWPLRLSADCLRFIGRYRRVAGFDIDPAALFQGVEEAD